MKQTKTNFSLKDQLFNKNTVQHLAELIFSAYPQLDKNIFIDDIVNKFPELELMDRIHHIVDMFEKHLPTDYPKVLEILLNSLPTELDPNKTDDDFGDFIYAPYGHFVSKNGCHKEHLILSLNALKEMTKRFSSEYGIRRFINEFEDETFTTMKQWSLDKNYHVRRLASEWLRPRLPWANNIWIDYKKPIEILDNLYTDQTRFVTRSVANHLNDIAKIDPKLVTDTLKKWKTTWAKDIDYIISHATRTLVKNWDSVALELLGYSPNPQVKIENFAIHNSPLTIPDSLRFSFDIISEEKQNLIIDYKLYFINKSWKLIPKVFKIKKWSFSNGTYTIEKNHLLKLMTTKALYPWQHFIEIIINGTSFGKKDFELKTS